MAEVIVTCTACGEMIDVENMAAVWEWGVMHVVTCPGQPMKVRPGPPAVDPGAMPGGYVIHVYGTDDGRLIYSTTTGPGDDLDIEAQAMIDADATAAGTHASEAIVLVFYDGDTGERCLPFGKATGDRL